MPVAVTLLGHADASALPPRSQLTDFASARTPKIATCSLSDMTSLSPGDIVTKLKARGTLLAFYVT